MANYWQPQAPQPGAHLFRANQPCIPSSNVHDMMYAFPRPRHTGRVTKPRSAGNSPSGRRRAAASQSSPTYQSVPSQAYKTPLNPALLASALRRRQTARPISWHPASFEPAYSSPPCLQTTVPDNFAAMPLYTQPLETMSATFTDGNPLPSYVSSQVSSPNEAFNFTNMQGPVPIQQSSFMDMNDPQALPVTWVSGISAETMPQPMSESWSFGMGSMNNSIPPADVTVPDYASAPSSGYLTGPSTPEFLPIQYPEDNSKPLNGSISDEEQSEDELVGMGLYNNPDPFLDSSLHEVSGKGLKLEETFTPSDDEDDGKDADNEDDEEETSEQVSSAPVQNQPSPDVCKQSARTTGNMMNKSFFFDDDLDQQNISAPQQFYNLGNQPCINYGYGWI
ncbi:hypothetical protein BDV25DRAFT_164586 [Aspergillus avenaceus]|uniref:Uncharacterized protein n=1 Tax=Aspergillus avenaceus TaxID=36643 RepID=A0A5N6TGM5_ASPAV|nr:hypothetical protein BDV25DRAFT_164586 [Aspergillus avenaceus]